MVEAGHQPAMNRTGVPKTSTGGAADGLDDCLTAVAGGTDV
jgi:hypothetical protein